MVKTNRAQREALFRVFQRDFPGWITPTKRIANPEIYRKDILPTTVREAQAFAKQRPQLIVRVPTTQWRRFRARVQPFIGGDCVMVPWAGMWLGIEKDGYTHS